MIWCAMGYHDLAPYMVDKVRRGFRGCHVLWLHLANIAMRGDGVDIKRVEHVPRIPPHMSTPPHHRAIR